MIYKIGQYFGYNIFSIIYIGVNLFNIVYKFLILTSILLANLSSFLVWLNLCHYQIVKYSN